jgi:hypothetical protein
MASETLRRAIYTAVPDSRIGAEDIESILTTARRRNPELGLTGALMFGKGSFVQILEGPAANLDLLLETIRKDPRHGDMTVVLRDPIEAREFADWAMAHVGGDDAVASLPGVHSLADLVAGLKSDGRIAASFVGNVRRRLG